MIRTSLSELISAANTITNETRAAFGSLSAHQLNWKPASESWSVGQCLDHLITSNATYFPTFEAILNGTKKSTFWERVPGLPRFFGKMLLKSVSPGSRRRLKAPAIFQPVASQVDGGIVQRFLDQQGEVIRTMEAAKDLDAAQIILTSPVSSVITYSLLDTYRILVAHEQRHLLQARRVTEMAGFGGGTE